MCRPADAACDEERKQQGPEPLGKGLCRKMTLKEIDLASHQFWWSAHAFLEGKRGLQRGGFTRFVWHRPGSASDPYRPVFLRLLAGLGLSCLLITDCTFHG